MVLKAKILSMPMTFSRKESITPKFYLTVGIEKLRKFLFRILCYVRQAVNGLKNDLIILVAPHKVLL